MLKFYKMAAITFCCLILFTLLLVFICIQLVFVHHPLLPASKSVIPWSLKANTDAIFDGSSTWKVTDATDSLDYEYFLLQTPEVPFPFVTQLLAFADLGNPDALIDIRAYSSVSFKATCIPHNVITFYVVTLDERVTDPQHLPSYRLATAPFSCENEETEIDIDLQHLKVPFWWLESFDLEVSNQSYRLDKVLALGFDASKEGPVNSHAQVTIRELSLHKFDWRPILIFSVVALMLWSGFVVWTIKQYSTYLLANLKDKLEQDRPLIAYQKLHLEPHKDREKSQLLKFMATEFANPDLNMEMAIEKLGINRTKLNELLKEEIGLTFNAYLNKLRLTAAAHQLSANKNISIQDIAYAVGYNNVSYFHKLFKSEYGCAPKTFQKSE